MHFTTPCKFIIIILIHTYISIISTLNLRVRPSKECTMTTMWENKLWLLKAMEIFLENSGFFRAKSASKLLFKPSRDIKVLEAVWAISRQACSTSHMNQSVTKSASQSRWFKTQDSRSFIVILLQVYAWVTWNLTLWALFLSPIECLREQKIG